MILICAACNARYLVPATVFSNGPRHVRCARCGNTWLEKLPPAPPPLPPETISIIKPHAATADDAVHAQNNGVQSQELPPVVDPPKEALPIQEGAGLPVVWSNPFWKRMYQLIVMLFVVASLGGLFRAITDRDKIVKEWPGLERFYYAAGMEIEHVGDGLSLQNVHSERTTDEGEASIVVSGEIHNGSLKIRPVPGIVATALGPDGGVLQGWQIDVPAVKLYPDASVPFRSSVKAPDGMVSEVILSFVEMRANGDSRGH